MSAFVAWSLLRDFAIVAPLAAVLSASFIVLLRPLLARHFVAVPDATSSHTAPTPQGAGIAVILAIVIAAGWAAALRTQDNDLWQIGSVLAATLFLAVAGLIDDARSLRVATRLILQVVAVLAVVAALPAAIRIAPLAPLWLERSVLLLLGLWCINATNCMDGIDWMTVAEVIPVSAAIVILAVLGAVPAAGLIVALALLGAIIGFAPFNRPVATLFLGNAGSLPIGLLLFWLLTQLAAQGHPATALLLILYYLADATITLIVRAARGESPLLPHRDHFYQGAIARGISVQQVLLRVAAANIALAGLAILSLSTQSLMAEASSLMVGCVIVALLLVSFTQGRS